jgi:hypothetical protein
MSIWQGLTVDSLMLACSWHARNQLESCWNQLESYWNQLESYWHARNQLVYPQDLSGRSQMKLVKIYFHKKFQLKQTNGFRVMAFQSLAQNGHIWHHVLSWEIQKYCIMQHLLYCHVLNTSKYSKYSTIH